MLIHLQNNVKYLATLIWNADIKLDSKVTVLVRNIYLKHSIATYLSIRELHSNAFLCRLKQTTDRDEIIWHNYEVTSTLHTTVGLKQNFGPTLWCGFAHHPLISRDI